MSKDHLRFSKVLHAAYLNYFRMDESNYHLAYRRDGGHSQSQGENLTALLFFKFEFANLSNDE
jgi:hypothetical protein